MHAKNNRQNHDFQIAYFLAGDCHTPDGAYALLCDLKEDRENALGLVESAQLREQAKRLRAQKLLASTDEADQLEGRADISEIEALAATTRRNVAAAKAELATIEKCMEILQPMRLYRHLSDAQAHEAAQRVEWKFELIRRAENFLMTQGTIPADHFNTMRLHPDFKSDILPALANVKALVLSRDPGALEELRKLQDRPRAFDLPKILEALPNYVRGAYALENPPAQE
jgi:hypothetical protein